MNFLGIAFTSVDDAVADSWGLFECNELDASPDVCGPRGGLTLWYMESRCAKMIPWEVNRLITEHQWSISRLSERLPGCR